MHELVHAARLCSRSGTPTCACCARMMAVSRSTISGEQCSCSHSISTSACITSGSHEAAVHTIALHAMCCRPVVCLRAIPLRTPTFNTSISPSRYARMMTGTSALICKQFGKTKRFRLWKGVSLQADTETATAISKGLSWRKDPTEQKRTAPAAGRRACQRRGPVSQSRGTPVPSLSP